MSSTTTAIQWTDATWNPVRGCSRVSPGCENCYAEKLAARFSGPAMTFEGFAQIRSAGARWTGRVELVPAALEEPLRWKKGRRVFVNSMSDLFHEALPDEAIAEVFVRMLLAPQHTFQILTKRADRMRRWMEKGKLEMLAAMQRREATTGWATFYRSDQHHRQVVRHDEWIMRWFQESATWPLPNVWMGVSVEDQRRADERIPDLIKTRAAVRFVSYEPALGPVDLAPWLHYAVDGPPPGHVGERLDWVIVGGESGPGARPFDLRWGRKVVDDCREAGVAVFVKQLGAVPLFAISDLESGHFHAGQFFPGMGLLRLSDRKGGDMDEWPRSLRVRQFPRCTGTTGTPTADGGSHAVDHPVSGPRL